MEVKSVYLLTTFEGVARLANFLASRAAILVGCAPLQTNYQASVLPWWVRLPRFNIQGASE